MNFPRASGILLHPTSLPGRFGIGDFGPSAYAFVDFLAEAGQSYWQILPLGPTGPGNSPYSSFSAFAGSTLLISPEKLAADGLISDDAFGNAENGTERVNFGKVCSWKPDILYLAFENLRSTPDSPLKDEFDFFCRTNEWWLEDYATFRAVKTSHEQKPWYEW